MNMNKKDMGVLCRCWKQYIYEDDEDDVEDDEDDVVYNHHRPEEYISHIWNEPEYRVGLSTSNVSYDYDRLNLLQSITHKPKSAIVGVINEYRAPFNIQCLILTYIMNENQYDRENKDKVELNNIWVKWKNKGR